MQIILERGRVWKLEELPQFSIALDGAVAGPIIDAKNHRFSFDHHAFCSRFCTLSTCQQTCNAVELGLDPSNYNIYCNDIDIDLAMAIWCLQNPSRCSEPLAIKLISAVNIGDMYLGAIKTNGMQKIVEYVSGPETDSKKCGNYNKLSTESLLSILEAILHRIDLYVDGNSQIEVAKIHKHNDYKILRNENNYVVVESYDTHIFSTLYQAGFERLVVVRPQDDNSLAITFAKKSDFVDNFPLETIYEKLNELEPGHGGSSTCGGSPRNPDGSRSKLPLEQILSVIDNIVKQP